MGWRTIVVNSHCKVSSKLQMLVVQTSELTVSVPFEDINVIVIASDRSVVTTRAMCEMAKRNIKVVFCDEKRLPISQNLPVRSRNRNNEHLLNQFRWDEERKALLWQRIVQEKIQEQSNTLTRCACEGVSELLDLIPNVEKDDSTNREAVSAHMYFPRLFTYEFTRSDDENELNALLNYGYAILLSEVSRMVSACGYLNEIGIHHDSVRNSFNLACDFMEPFRPFIDERVFHLGQVELNTVSKLKLVQLLQEDNASLGTTLTKAVTSFVRACLKYLEKGGQLPSVHAKDSEPRVVETI